MSTLSSPAQSIVDQVEVDRINYLNIILMGLSVCAAAYLPFETFLISYAVLGPLHYLTEISWLHDREYFALSSRDWRWLLVAAVIATIGAVAQTETSTRLSGFATGAVSVGAVGMAFARSYRARAFIATLAVLTGLLVQVWSPLLVLFTAFLPTLIHVYVFTGLFILYGAMKGRSVSGMLSLAAYLVAPFVCFFGISTPATYAPTDSMLQAFGPFAALGTLGLEVLNIPVTRETWLGFVRLMGFAYSYHYLNWFSKTRIINWHRIPRRRFVGIVAAYLLAVSAYAYDYFLGFILLMFLSIAHVTLELPLNVRTIVGIWDGIFKPLRKTPAKG